MQSPDRPPSPLRDPPLAIESSADAPPTEARPLPPLTPTDAVAPGYPSGPAGPVRPGRRLFYGWVMLAVAVGIAAASQPGQSTLITLFNDSLRESLGISLTRLGLLYAVATVLAALPLSLVGRAADRFGVRVVVGVVSVLFVSSLWVLSAAKNEATLALGFFLVRFFGQGSLGMLAAHTLTMWFERRLGTVQSLLAVLGFSASSAIAPWPTAWLIDAMGWRSAMLVLAGGVFALTVPAVLLVFRNTPREVGQHIDGLPADYARHDVIHGGPPPPGDPGFTLLAAVRTRAYWVLAVGAVMAGVFATSLIFHMPEMLREAGLEGSERQTARMISTWAITFGLAMLPMGRLTDLVPPARLQPWAPTLTAAACLIILAAVRGWTPLEPLMLVTIGMGVFGVGQAVGVAVLNPTVPRFFGRTHHGAIRGSIGTATVAGTGGGPLVASLVHDAAGGTFTPVLLLFAASCVPLAIAAATLRKPAA